MSHDRTQVRARSGFALAPIMVIVMGIGFADVSLAALQEAPPTAEELATTWGEMEDEARLHAVLSAHEANPRDKRITAMLEELADEGQAAAEYPLAVNAADIGKRRLAHSWYRKVAAHDREGPPPQRSAPR